MFLPQEYDTWKNFTYIFIYLEYTYVMYVYAKYNT